MSRRGPPFIASGWTQKERRKISGRRYPDRPFLGVGGVVIRGGEVLLARRGQEPLLGFWSIPGGVVENGETLRDAVRREMREETGLTVEPLAVVEVFERITRDDAGSVEFHFVVVDFLCRVTGGEAEAADDASEVAWFSRNALPSPITEGAPGVIEKAFAHRERDTLGE